jgi:predicted Zn-dependent peptidase
MLWDPYSEFQSATLGNGLTIHAVQMPCTWQRMRFSIHSGATQDPDGKLGLAHFTEHVVSENAPLSCQAVEDYFRDLGGDVMLGATAYWRTYYGFYIPAEDEVVRQSLDLFGSMLLTSKLEKRIKREREVILNEYNKKYPVSFGYDIKMKSHAVLFKDMALGRSLDSLGIPETIKVINEHDLQSFYDQHYTPANMTIVAVGAYTLDQLVHFFSESSFAIEKPGVRTAIPPFSSFADVEQDRIEVIMSDYVDLTLLAPSFSYESYVKIPLSFSFATVAICCRMLTELLDEEIRQRLGWTYSISSKLTEYVPFRRMQITSSSIAIKGLESIEEKVDSIIDRIFSATVLFEKIKKNRLAAALMNDESGLDVLNNAFDELYFMGKIITYEQGRKNLNAVTFEDVCTVASYWKSKSRLTVISKP